MKTWKETGLNWTSYLMRITIEMTTSSLHGIMSEHMSCISQATKRENIMWIMFNYQRTCCTRRSHWPYMSTMKKLWRGNECSKLGITNFYRVHLKEYIFWMSSIYCKSFYMRISLGNFKFMTHMTIQHNMMINRNNVHDTSA